MDKIKKLKCIDCEAKQSCEVYTFADKTLDLKQNFYKLHINMDLLINAPNKDLFEKFWKKEGVVAVAEDTATMIESIVKYLDSCGYDYLTLGGEVNLEALENKETFNQVAEHIEVLHANTEGDIITSRENV